MIVTEHSSNTPKTFNRMTCPICIANSGSVPNILEKTGHWILRHSEKEKNCPGYLYLEPVKHVENLSELTADSSLELGILMKKACEWIQSNFAPKKVYTVTISEKVPHIHFHIVPRYSENPVGLDYLRLALNSELRETDLSNSGFLGLQSAIQKYSVQ